MRIRLIHRPALWAACLLLLLPAWSYGRVFSLGGGSRYGGLAGESLDAQRLDTTQVQIGQGQGELQSWGATAWPDELIGRIHELYNRKGWPVFSASGSALGWAAAVTPQGHLLRYLAVATGRRQSVLFELGQSRTDYEASGASSPYLFEAAPLFPGGSPLRYLADLDKGTELQSVDVNAGPGEVAQYYAEHFIRNGWAPALPPARTGEARPMEMYVKGGTLCVVQAYFSGQSQRCTVLLLKRSPGTFKGGL